MALSYQQLTTPVTEDKATEDAIEVLDDLGFTASSWPAGSDQFIFTRLAGRLWSKLTEFADGIAKLGNNEDASGTGLTRYSKSVYDNTRTPATRTAGKMLFTTLASEGPHSPAIGDIVVTDGVSMYRNIEAGTLTGEAPVSLLMEATEPGSKSVISDGAVLQMVTTLPGVTVTNPAIAGSDTWMTHVGTDEEKDERLRTRNSTKWATLGAAEVVFDRTVNLMLNASPTIKKVFVHDENPRGPFTVDVYIGGEISLVSDDDLAAAQEVLDLNFFKNRTTGQLPRAQALKTNPLVLAVFGAVYFDARFDAAVVQANVEAAILEFIKSVPIGGFNYPPALVRVVTVGDIQQAIENAPGVLTADITSPSANITFNFDQQLIPHAVHTLAYHPVNPKDYNG